MLTLALDTTGNDFSSVALFDGARELVTHDFRHDRRLSERLPGIIQFLLSDAGFVLAHVEAFVVGLGPGSFTGVRIGVTLAKTLAFAQEKPIVGISSLDALAFPYIALPGVRIAAVVPTRRGECVAAFYAGMASPVAPPAVIAHAELTARAEATLPGAGLLLIVGESADAVASTGEAANAVFLPAFVSAAHVARLAVPRIAAGQFDDVSTLTPFYVTPTPVGPI